MTRTPYDLHFDLLLRTVRDSEQGRALQSRVPVEFSDVPAYVIPVGDPRAQKVAEAVQQYKAAVQEIRRLENVLINLCDETLADSEGELL